MKLQRLYFKALGYKKGDIEGSDSISLYHRPTHCFIPLEKDGLLNSIRELENMTTIQFVEWAIKNRLNGLERVPKTFDDFKDKSYQESEHQFTESWEMGTRNIYKDLNITPAIDDIDTYSKAWTNTLKKLKKKEKSSKSRPKSRLAKTKKEKKAGKEKGSLKCIKGKVIKNERKKAANKKRKLKR